MLVYIFVRTSKGSWYLQREFIDNNFEKCHIRVEAMRRQHNGYFRLRQQVVFRFPVAVGCEEFSREIRALLLRANVATDLPNYE